MRIIGIDPGYALVGWAVIDQNNDRSISLCDYGVISTSKDLPLESRLSEIYHDMTQIINRFKPDIAGIETLIFHRNVTTAMKVSEARGVVVLSLNEASINIVHISPLQVKNAISGYGRAPKSQVQENVKMLCGLNEIPKPDDAADAVAVAITTCDINFNNSLLKRI